MKRLFAAVKIDTGPGFIRDYRDLITAMRSQQIKWVEERNIHITLKFFGDTEEKMIPRISEVLEQRSLSSVPFTIRLNGLGIFGSRYDPRVIWAGIEPYETLACLMKDLQQDLRSLGYEPDRQNLVPHLTLGRVKMVHDRELFNRALEQFRKISSEGSIVREIILFESILRREGPQYSVTGTFPFSGE